ncbi:hypothetical protein DBR11_04975 [Pedobacter sp. HMWF019]|nr:hypothetical protein DBR11_04975 [Pedobacter sp. HMWF019]
MKKNDPDYTFLLSMMNHMQNLHPYETAGQWYGIKSGT